MPIKKPNGRRILGKGEGSGCGGREGVEQRNLEQVEAVLLSLDQAARFVVDELHALVAVEVAREAAELVVHGIQQIAVDLHTGNGTLSKSEGREDISAVPHPAGSDPTANRLAASG